MLRTLKSHIRAHEKVNGRSNALRRRFNALAGGNYVCTQGDTNCFYRRRVWYGGETGKYEVHYLIVFAGKQPLRYYNESDAANSDDAKYSYFWGAVEDGKWQKRYEFDGADLDSYDESKDETNKLFQYPSNLPDPGKLENWNL